MTIRLSSARELLDLFPAQHIVRRKNRPHEGKIRLARDLVEPLHLVEIAQLPVIRLCLFIYSVAVNVLWDSDFADIAVHRGDSSADQIKRLFFRLQKIVIMEALDDDNVSINHRDLRSWAVRILLEPKVSFIVYISGPGVFLAGRSVPCVSPPLFSGR
jgi:hypothetical protein